MIQQKIGAIRREIGQTQLIVVSKYRSMEELNEVYKSGERKFGENRVQEIIKKAPMMPNDIEWHLIGHLQTNKVKQILPYVSLIHSVDSIKLLNEIEQQAQKLNRVMPVLLQIHVSTDETKFGFDPNELIELAKSGILNQFEHIQFKGIMTMSTLNATNDQVKSEFATAYQCFLYLKPLMPNPSDFTERSYGMSGDYQLAIEEHATIVRIGSLIFE